MTGDPGQAAPHRIAILSQLCHVYTWAAYLAQRAAVRAEAELHAGLRAIAAVPDLASMGPSLRRSLVEALVLQGKLAQADSVVFKGSESLKAAMWPKSRH